MLAMVSADDIKDKIRRRRSPADVGGGFAIVLTATLQCGLSI
jgi:hypothetical protein